MTNKSIFDNLYVSASDCTSAVKNITQIDDQKCIILTLEFKASKDDAGKDIPGITLGASYVLAADGQLLEGESVKVYCKVYKNEDREEYTKTSHRYFSGGVPDVVYNDIHGIATLFCNADESVQRVL